jgi:hypothetical protein
MTDTALYYAFSTIAQCAAALAALIGFLGMWQLDRLREERGAVEFALQTSIKTVLPLEELMQQARSMAHDQQQPGSHLEALIARWDALQGAQRQLLWVLRIFLFVTRATLGAAVVGFLYVGKAMTWAWTPWLLWMAGILLAGGPIIVVWVAARLPRVLTILAVLLALASPALAGQVRCTTYEEKTMDRLQTLCDDGSRAVSTWNRTLECWETTVASPPSSNRSKIDP